MLIVCNGALKSGSTWLFNILTSLVPVEHPPEEYLTGRSRHNPCIPEDKVEDFLQKVDIRSKNYISKNHYNKLSTKQILLAHPDVYVFDIERNIRDMIVSAYYHDQRMRGFKGSFSSYYWREGRRLADFIVRYHRLWADEHPRVFVASYERLKQDFDAEVGRIASVLGVQTTTSQRVNIKKETSLSSLKERYKDSPQHSTEEIPFFRKGEVGDWRNHFSKLALADLARIEARGLSPFDPIELLKNTAARITGLVNT